MRYTFLGRMSLALEHRDLHPSTTLVTLTGKLLLGQESLKLEALVPQLIASGHKNLVFDIGGVTHIDSTGIGRFIDTYSRLAKVGGKMRLAGAKGAVRDSFHVTRLDTVFAFYPTVEAACQGLA
jgi:anti-sigma B factor antagonist